MSTWRPRRPRPEELEPRPVVASLDQVAAGLGGPRASVLATVFDRWEELVGPEIAAHATPRSLRDGVLVVAADQPAWAAQLRYLAGSLLDRLREATGGPEVRELQIRVAGSAPPRAAPPGRGRDTPLW